MNYFFSEYICSSRIEFVNGCDIDHVYNDLNNQSIKRFLSNNNIHLHDKVLFILYFYGRVKPEYLLNLKKEDISFDDKVIIILYQGKKRIIPLKIYFLNIIKNYLNDMEEEDTIIVNEFGEKMVQYDLINKIADILSIIMEKDIKLEDIQSIVSYFNTTINKHKISKKRKRSKLTSNHKQQIQSSLNGENDVICENIKDDEFNIAFPDGITISDKIVYDTISFNSYKSNSYKLQKL